MATKAERKPTKTYAFNPESNESKCCKLASWFVMILLLCTILAILLYYKTNYKRVVSIRPHFTYNSDVEQAAAA